LYIWYVDWVGSQDTKGNPVWLWDVFCDDLFFFVDLSFSSWIFSFLCVSTMCLSVYRCMVLSLMLYGRYSFYLVLMRMNFTCYYV
jgi:hypothetical protein